MVRGGGGFLTPQGLPNRSSIVTSTPFPGQNLSSLPFTPARPSLQSPLHPEPVQPLFTQPTALRQLPSRPLAQASHLSNIRNEPLLESDEEDYETSEGFKWLSERKSPRHQATKDGELAKTKTVAAGQPVTTPPQPGGDEDTDIQTSFTSCEEEERVCFSMSVSGEDYC